MEELQAIKRAIKQQKRLINYMLWHKDQVHTEKSLARFFRNQKVKSRLDHLVSLGILEQHASEAYTVSKNQQIRDILKRVNDHDRTIRQLVNRLMSQIV